MFKKIKYLSGFSALAISEGFYDMAFVVMAYRISGQASTAAVAYALGYAAEIIVSLAIGGFLDNVSRKRLFNYTIALKSCLFVFIIIYSNFSDMSSIAIWIFAFLADLLHHVSRTANTVSLFQIFNGKDKASMQGAVISISGLLRIAGPLLAGSIIGIVSSPSYLLLICLLLQGISLWSFSDILPSLPLRKTSEAVSSFRDNVLGSMRALKEALSSSTWRWFFVTDALATLFVGTLTLMLFPLLRQLHDASESQAGLFMGLAAIGTIIIGLLFERILTRMEAIHAAKFGLICSAICALALSIRSGYFILGLTLIAFQCGSTLFFRSMGMFLQNEVSEENLGSWWTASDAFGRIFGMLGIFLGGYLFDFVGGATFCMLLGACILMSVIGLSQKPLTLKAAALSIESR